MAKYIIFIVVITIAAFVGGQVDGWIYDEPEAQYTTMFTPLPSMEGTGLDTEQIAAELQQR